MEPVCVSTIGADEAVGSSTKQAPPFGFNKLSVFVASAIRPSIRHMVTTPSQGKVSQQ
jgi:hypothetical protein